MKKNRKIIILFIIVAFLLFTTTKVNAAETFSTESGIVATKVVEGFSGNIEFNLSNITLSSEENYVWAVGTTSLDADITKWYPLGDFSEANKTARISLVISDKEILDILRTTNTAYLYIKETKTDNLLINALKVDLTLSPYHAFDLYEWLDDYYVVGGNKSSTQQWSGATYNIRNVWYKFEKVTDENKINQYNQAVDNKTSIEDIFSISVNDIDKLTDWQDCTTDGSVYPNTKIEKEKLPADDGLYILYMKAKDTDSKMVYGYRIWPLDLRKVETGSNTNKEDKEENRNNESTGSQEENKGVSITGGKEDPTTAKKILPNTGITKIIISITFILSIAGIVLYIKYKNIPLK